MRLESTLSASGSVAEDEVNFDSSMGYVLQAEYLFSQVFSIGLKYTGLSYQASGTRTNFDASSVGFNMNFFLGQSTVK